MRAAPRRERRVIRQSAPTTSFDEKFDALRIDHADYNPTQRIIFSSDPEHVDAAATEQYVKEVLKDSKNRLAFSALSANNPAVILEKPSAILKDTQYFNLTIPHEGTPVCIMVVSV